MLHPVNGRGLKAQWMDGPLSGGRRTVRRAAASPWSHGPRL